MHFARFETLPPSEISALVRAHMPQGFGVGVHFDGTRRWYIQTFGVEPNEIYAEDYVLRIMQQIRRVARMMFDDGVTAIYLPALGARIETERGPEYARFQMESLARELTRPEMLDFCRELAVEQSCYGALDRFPADLRQPLESLPQQTRSEHTSRYMRWATFAGSPLNDICERVVRLHGASGRVPTDRELIENYYGGPHVPLCMWIGQECPAIYGIPLLFNSRTNLYFLQFPTPLLDHSRWRRLLFDALYVRGEQSSLCLEKLSEQRQIVGLGQRIDGFWKADHDG
jgi:hypothetical protein